jgi:hypothetical protein
LGTAEAGNSSGEGEAAIVPDEIRGWNWGASLLGWIWAIGNKRYDVAAYGLGVYILFFLLGPVGWLAQLVMSIIFGAKGNEWAWRSKKWRSIEHFKRTQRTWARWGIVALILNLLLALWAGIAEFGIYHI